MSNRRTHLLPVSNGLLEYPHRERMGSAVWLFLQLIDWTTSEDNGVGHVLGGRIVTVGQIGQALRLSERQVKEHLKTLRDHGYIHVKRMPYGMTIDVVKSKKFIGRDRRKSALPEVQESAPLEVQETAPLEGEIGGNPPQRSAEIRPSLYNNVTKERMSADAHTRHKKTPPNPDIKPFFHFFDEKYRERTGTPYPFNGGKDGTLIGQQLRVFTLDELKDVAVRFFDTDDEWIREKGGFTIGVFCSQIAKLNSIGKAGPKARKELRA